MLSVNQATQETLWPPGGWLTKKEAAKRLGLSESRILALGAELGKLQTRMERHPTLHQTVTLFHEGDVERFIFERDNPSQVAKVPSKPSNLPVPVYPPERAGDVLRAGWKPVQEKPWITVVEAAEYSGLPASAIEKLIKSKELPALDCGPRPGGRYRVKRIDLDKLEGTR